MTDIRVFDLFGPICVDTEDGAKLCGLAQEVLGRGETVCLDFTNITTLTNSFLNMAVGCLYSSFGKEELAQRLHWKGLDPTDEGVMRFVQRNAIRFYSANQNNQEALLSASAHATGE